MICGCLATFWPDKFDLFAEAEGTLACPWNPDLLLWGNRMLCSSEKSIWKELPSKAQISNSLLKKANCRSFQNHGVSLPWDWPQDIFLRERQSYKLIGEVKVVVKINFWIISTIFYENISLCHVKLNSNYAVGSALFTELQACRSDILFLFRTIKWTAINLNSYNLFSRRLTKNIFCPFLKILHSLPIKNI